MRPGAEWLESDGLGGFASGPVSGGRTRRYHAILLAATNPPTGRVVLVNGFDAWVETPGGRYELTTQRYAPDVDAPHGARWLAGFTHEPWPRWTFRLPDGMELTQELVVPRGVSAAVVTWSVRGRRGAATLVVRPYLSGRDTHSTHHANDAFRFDASVQGERVEWQPYPDLPAIVSLANARYDHAPDWYRNFQYDDERDRGLDFLEDLAAPGTLTFDLAHGDAVWILAAGGAEADRFLADEAGASRIASRARGAERVRRTAFPTPLHRAADQYIVRRGTGTSIIAGYPWFSDWGRDTFIAVRGLCIATGRLEEARSTLLAWADLVSEGMLPNYFPEGAREPEYNSVDASLWYIVAVHDLLAACDRARKPIATSDRTALEHAARRILTGYARGTRYGIRADEDGLLCAGEPGVQLTWMDARVNGREVTPRIGKPVEVQALWINALRIGSFIDPAWAPVHRQAQAAFAERFWNAELGCLYDVVDVDHHAGTVDATLRPNQILAVGGLPFPVLIGETAAERARSIVDVVEAKLWTPLGLRSLTPDSPGYAGRYGGTPAERDAVYHQGTVWPWLAGPFIEAWLSVRGSSATAKAEARERLLPGLVRHLEEAGLGHVSEIADGDPPHTPRGCPFQAWSVGELLRILNGPLALRRAPGPPRNGHSEAERGARNRRGVPDRA